MESVKLMENLNGHMGNSVNGFEEIIEVMVGVNETEKGRGFRNWHTALA